jgi:hypothetical protein
VNSAVDPQNGDFSPGGWGLLHVEQACQVALVFGALFCHQIAFFPVLVYTACTSDQGFATLIMMIMKHIHEGQHQPAH